MSLLQLIATTGYVSSFLLLPLIIYTNINEQLNITKKNNKKDLIPNLHDYERNQKSVEILSKIEKKLSCFTDDKGVDCLTIKNGRQARFMKFGLDYISQRLSPTDPEIIDRIDEFTNMYKNNTKRVFTGSGWIIGCSIIVGILVTMPIGRTSGNWTFDTFFFIHFLGLIFYIVASRTSIYSLRERSNMLGERTGLISMLMTTLFMGNTAKHYVKEGEGPWERDRESEGIEGLFYLMLLVVVSLLLGFLTAFLGLISFFLNYSTSLILPIESEDKWYEKNFH